MENPGQLRQVAHHLEEPECAHGGHFAGGFRNFEAQADMALAGQVIELLGPDLDEDAAERGIAPHQVVPERAGDVQADHVIEGRADPAVDLLELLVQVVVLGQRRRQLQLRARDEDAASAQPHADQAEQRLHDQEGVQQDMREPR